MSVAEHRSASPQVVPCLVLTVSDTRTRDTDTSGQAIASLLEAAGHTVVARELVPDDPAKVAEAIRAHLGRKDVRAVITTGGTGITSRDSTYEAVSAMFDKHLDGFGELFRMLSYEQVGAAAMLSRACAGVVTGHIVFVLPGSEAAVRLAMEKLILPELGHVVRETSR
ncbi:MAG: MogA/MoaB family molybdenum cofactor biosynthesis protein [Acidobacteria bacterium]|jgi:molybdopterin adenylyltransferase|nr:MogA/MoaB family molybdenum cofactor biosynthesis protein [Acidobacteriota bacterium]